MRRILPGGVAVGLLVAALLALAALPGSAGATPVCGGRYHQITRGDHGAVLILRQRNLSCRTIRTVGLQLLAGAHLPGRVDGLMCRRLDVKAGGGAARCTRGRGVVEFGFE